MLFDHEFEAITPSTTGFDSITIGGTAFPAALNLPSGTTVARTVAPVAGSFRWNTTNTGLEVFDGTQWSALLLVTAQSARTILAAPVGSSGLPSFRLQGLGEHSDVTLTSPSATQILSYTGSQWVNTSIGASNAAGLIGVSNSSGGSAWSQVGATTRYTATFTHSLGTQNVVVTVYDTVDNSIVIPDKVIATDANTVTVTVVGNTKTLKVVVVANGTSIVAGGSTPSSIVTAYQGVTVSTAATKLNFVGSTVVTDAGGGTTTVSIGARFSFAANSLDSPNNSDWAVNAFAPVITDPTYPAMNVRSFSNTVEQGVGFIVSIPSGATVVTFRYRGRAAAAITGATNVVGMRVYYRGIPNNAVVSGWSGALDLNNLTIPASSVNAQYFVQSAPLIAAGLVAGQSYQFEFTRKVAPATGTQLAAAFLLGDLTFEFA